MSDRARIEAWLSHRKAQKLDRNGESQAAVAMVLREGEDETEMLFITRATHPADPWSGHIAFPGGRFELSDAHLTETAVRETLEEVSLDLRQHSLLGMLDELSGRRANHPAGVIIACFVYWINPSKVLDLRANYEVAEFEWISLSHLLDSANTIELSFDFSDQPYPAIRFPGDDKALWGLTYRFVSPLLEVLQKR